MAAKYLCWGDFTLTDPWRLLRACCLLNKQELYQCRQPQKQREWYWSEQGTSLCWFYTHAHATTDQSAEIAPDTWHAANKADKHRGMRGSARRKRPAKREGVDVRAQWMTSWCEEAGVMGCEVEDLGRQQERPSACQHNTDSLLSCHLLSSLSVCDSDTQTLVQSHHSGQER